MRFRRCACLVLVAFLLVMVMASPRSVVFSQDPLPLNEEGHPRLFFSASDIPTLRANAGTTHRDIWIPISEYVDSLHGTSPPSVPPQQGDEDFYRDEGNRLIAIAFACVITGEDEDCELAKRYLLVYASWEQWGDKNERRLGHSHMLLGNALAYDWIHTYLTPQEKRTVSRNLAVWAEKMYEASTLPYREPWENWWRRAYMQNHFWVANSALGIVGLALLEREAETEAICQVTTDSNVNLRTGPGTNYDIRRVFQAGRTISVYQEGAIGTDGMVWWQTIDGVWVRSDVVGNLIDCTTETLRGSEQKWVSHAINQISRGREILNGIADGTWHESIPYQNYLLTMTLPFMQNILALQNVDLLPHEYLKNYIQWRLYNQLPDGGYLFTYGDFEYSWQHGFEPQNILRFVAAKYADPHAEWVAQQIIQTHGRGQSVSQVPWYVFEFLYYDPTIEPSSPNGLPGARVFEDAEAVVWRTGWDENDLVFGLRLGTYGGRFAYDTFTQETYPWDPPCYQTKCTLSIGHDHDDTNTFYLYQGERLANEVAGNDFFLTSLHNTILIDEQTQYRPPYENYGELPSDFIGKDPILETIVDSVGFNYLVSEARQRYTAEGMEHVTRHVLFVRPDYLVMLDSMASTQAHRYEWVSHFGQAVTAEQGWLQGGGRNGRILGVGVVAPDPFEVTIGDDGLPYARIRAPHPVDDMRFITLLYPTDEDGWANRPDTTLLDDNGTAAVLQVQWNEGSAQTDDILIRYANPATATQVAGYNFDGQVAVVTYGEDGQIKKMFAYGGTSLTVRHSAAVVLVGNLNPDIPFEADFAGKTVSLFGANLSGVELYAPGMENVTVNSEEWSFAISGDHVVLGGPIE